MRVLRNALLSLAVAAGALPAAAGELVTPAYPDAVANKVVEANVVVRATLDGAGKVAATETVFNDGEAAFGAAAATALAATAFDGGAGEVFVWYTYRLTQSTLARDISPDLPPAYDAEPTLVEATAPTFPPGAPSLRTEVELKLLVGKDGRVWYARPAAPGGNELYNSRAVAAALTFRFEPAQKEGKAVPAWYPFILDFK